MNQNPFVYVPTPEEIEALRQRGITLVQTDRVGYGWIDGDGSRHEFVADARTGRVMTEIHYLAPSPNGDGE